MSNKLVSIHIPSNRASNLEKVFNRLQDVTHDPNAIEVIINLDHDDTTISAYLDEQIPKRPFHLKYIKTFNGGFYNSWKPINDILAYADPNAYFYIFLSDEFLFNTNGWDTHLKHYVNYYPDDIFRLRASQFKYRNYSDFWECGFAPDSIAFTTRKWVETINNWSPCFSSDAFQQFVSYYLFTSDPFTRDQLNRDIPIPFIRFEGEGASIGLSGNAALERARGGLRAWFELVSYPMQLEAKRRAMLLKAAILTYADTSAYVITDDTKNLKIMITDSTDQSVKHELSYKLSKIKIKITNFIRIFDYLYYAGGGAPAKSPWKKLRRNLTYYLDFRYERLRGLHDKCNHYSDVLFNRIKRLITSPNYFIKRFMSSSRDK